MEVLKVITTFPALAATGKPKVLLILDDALLERIDDYRYDNRIPSRNEAMRQLLKESLEMYEKEKEGSK